ncbi:MAG: NADH-quinone oxidoreductase subunit A [Verrucomicrobiae bacterium]|nr:NADH-quinone oxidoreductase subunit A [Verrucomicrobiae bacterium]
MTLGPYELNYLILGVLFLMSVAFAVGPLLIAWLITPRKPSKIKNEMYECGVQSETDAWVQFKVQYYVYALVFVIVAIATIFVYPLAVIYKSLGGAGLLFLTSFLGLISLGVGYAWKKGVLEWS